VSSSFFSFPFPSRWFPPFSLFFKERDERPGDMKGVDVRIRWRRGSFLSFQPFPFFLPGHRLLIVSKVGGQHALSFFPDDRGKEPTGSPPFFFGF